MARRVEVGISINSKDITKNISPHLTGLRINDILEGESSTAEIELEDRERLWVNDWFPDRGDSCDIVLTKYDWHGEGEVETISFNGWEIDEIENSFPPNKCKIKLNSISNETNSRGVNKSKSWEKVKLSKISRDIAESGGYELVYFAPEDPEVDRAEQKTESDLAFLKKLCADYGYIVRCSEGKLSVCDESELEKADSAITFRYGDNFVKSFSGRATVSKIYGEAHVVYNHGKKKQKIEYTYKDANKQGGMTLEINKKVNSEAEAERLAKKELRQKNKSEIQVRLNVIGDFRLLAGNVITLDESFGFYAGRYIIERSDISVGNGFSMDLELRKCLSGY